MEVEKIQDKKPTWEAECCAECEHIWNDNGVFRCRMFDNAKVEDLNEKHCRDCKD